MLAGLGVTAPAFAHPHVIVAAKAAFLIDESGKITGIRQEWTFDEAYSAFSTTGFKKGPDGKFLKPQLEDLAKLNVDSLKDFDYFTSLKQGREKLEFAEPLPGYFLEFNGTALVLNFILPLKKPAATAKPSILRIDDETFFVAFSYEDKNPVSIEGKQTNCRIDLKKPAKDVKSSELSRLSEDMFNSMQSGFGAQYSGAATLICQ